MNKSSRTGVVLAFLCLLLLGAMPILSNARPAGSSGLDFAVWLTAWQLLAALPPFFIERRRRGRRPSAHSGARTGGRTAAIALATGAMFGLATYMYVVAAERAGAISMVLALQAYPLFAILWETLFLGKRKSAAELLCTLVMIGALYYLTTAGTLLVSGISWWSLFALGIPLLWSVAHILLKRVLETTPITPSEVTVSRSAISGVFLLVLAVAVEGGGPVFGAFTDLPFQRAAAVMGVAYCLELILWFHAMRHIDVSTASTITVPAPAVTMLISVLVLGESVQVYQVVAMAVIAVGIYGLLIAGRRKAARAPAPSGSGG